MLPYLKFLLPVKGYFIGGILCGIIYGLASGFGLPFMTSKVFPIIFAQQEHPGTVYLQTETGDYIPGGEIQAISLDDSFFLERNDALVKSDQKSFKLTQDGQLSRGEALYDTNDLRYQTKDGETVSITPGFYVKNSKDEYIPAKPEDFEPVSKLTLLGAVAILPLAFFIRGLSGFFNTYLIRYCGTKVLEDIRRLIFAKLQVLPLGFYQRNTAGDLMARMNGDTARLQSLLTITANDLIKQPITMLGALGALVVMSLHQREFIFLLLLLMVIPICVLPIRYAGKKLSAKAKEMQTQAGRLSEIMNEYLSSIKEVRAFNLQERERTKFEKSVRYLLVYTMKVVKYNNALPPTIEVITATGVAVSIYYTASKGVSVEQVIPLIFALYMAYEPVKKIGSIHSRIKEASASLERLEYILDEPVSIQDPESPKPFKSAKGEIALKQVHFSYEQSPILKDIELKLAPGETVALVGPSGAGKSTLVNLIPRFYEATKGSVTIDGTDVRDVTQYDLRQQIAIVSQEPILFNDTIANNIRCGKLDATDEEVKEAARNASAHEFIKELEDGYDTITGERGTRLSGGQRQRIAIARAFLKQAPILILDEATSALDSESEVKIQTALEKLVKGKTVIIIAHRFSTLRLASRIIFLNNGCIESVGTHDELYAGNPLYKTLCDHQF